MLLYDENNDMIPASSGEYSSDFSALLLLLDLIRQANNMLKSLVPDGEGLEDEDKEAFTSLVSRLSASTSMTYLEPKYYRQETMEEVLTMIEAVIDMEVLLTGPTKKSLRAIVAKARGRINQ